MKITLQLVDGREAVDELAQVTVANAHGDPVMAAYYGPAGAIVCGHVREGGWNQFLEDTGIAERVQVGSRPAAMHARVVPIEGSVSIIPVKRCIIYSDHGDPVIAAIVVDREVDVAHAGDRDWLDFCKQHEIFIPRNVVVQELI